MRKVEFLAKIKLKTAKFRQEGLQTNLHVKIENNVGTRNTWLSAISNG
jgi:hypothetical protein